MAPTLSSAPADRIIVALDGMAPEQVMAFAARVEGLRWVKVGLELFVQSGPQVVAQLREQGLRVFLDLKFHDIPATMAGACRRTAALGAELITVHACAGSEALSAAQAAALEGAKTAALATPSLLAVTVLTSWEQQRLQQELAIGQGIGERVSALAELSATAGIGGCICSPLEAAALRAQHPEPFALVTPGIRPKGAATGDQARVMGPAQAIAAGASQLVIGRPITKAEDPSAAFAACCDELRT
ncbi:orotidine-5'-phosphate decarboxylase [Synechococcus sp. CC9616]|uniref:orotidine-5'-phosphate decarboxylase n=1 Tax=Synechococcus sp. CC9616 TaxID=110663 RepID=UPI00048D78EA|nr:orotidine-5'-phosphate decarboxylase [Synechococcus sp. CC9616]